jgi:hypothetical protein
MIDDVSSTTRSSPRLRRALIVALLVVLAGIAIAAAWKDFARGDVALTDLGQLDAA